MTRFMALGLTLSGLVFLCLAIAFLLEQPWATALWPWMTYRLSKVFIASILAAIAAPILWIGRSREFAAITGGAVNLFVTFSGMAAYSFVAVAENSARRGILAFGVVCAAAALISLAMAFWARRLSFKDTRRLPMPVKISFGAFAIILMIIGLALVRAQPNIFPWILSRDLSVLYGLIFLGAACYFLYGFLVPLWGNAQGQLIGFLAYGAVLIAPLSITSAQWRRRCGSA